MQIEFPTLISVDKSKGRNLIRQIIEKESSTRVRFFHLNVKAFEDLSFNQVLMKKKY